MSDDSNSLSDDSDIECHKPVPESMTDGMVALFKSFILREDYDAAMGFVTDCFPHIPTPFVINEIVFKIMVNCEEKLAYKAADYLQCKMRAMFRHETEKSNFIKSLKNQSDTNPDVWDAFSHFMLSSLNCLKVTEACHSHKEYVKSPNCDLLVDIYIKAFLKCSIKSEVLGSRVEERLSNLLKWINLYYRNNFTDEPILCYLHELLDYIVNSEISSDPSLPLSVKINSPNLSQYISLILNICKDIFSTLEKLDKFFFCTDSRYLTFKVCQHRLHELMEDKSQPQYSEMLTLKSIVNNYFYQHPEKKSLIRESISSRRSLRGRQLKKFSKDPIPGDTNLHDPCRLGRPADLLRILYLEKANDINKKNSVGNTPLHEACLASSYLCCKFLIEESGDRKVDFKATESDGRTPLHCAVYVDAFDIVKLLLDRGGNDLVRCQDNCGKQPIEYSTSDEMKTMLQEVESKLEEKGEEESQDSVVSSQLKLPNLKNSKNYHLYLRTLRRFVSSYCEIYGLPKRKNSVKTFSHDAKECYHYKAGKGSLCMEDSSILETFSDAIMKYISCARLVSKEKNFESELLKWKLISAMYK